MKKVTLVLGVLTLLILIFYAWLNHTFGEIYLLQIAWYAAVVPDLETFDRSYLFTAALCILLFFVSAFLWCRSVSVWYAKKQGKAFVWFAPLLLSVSVFSGSVFYIGSAMKFCDYFSYAVGTEHSSFIEKNYAVPKHEDIVFTEKRNIVVILAESLENSFLENDEGVSYLPNLQALPYERQKKFYSFYLARHTIGALTAWSLGVPLKLPQFMGANSYKAKEFLPHALSVYDILQEHGYCLKLVMGSSKDFGGIKGLFASHGAFHVQDRDYFAEQGWDLTQYQGTGWGYNDKFVLERAYEEFLALQKEHRPFVLFVQTIDTHAPYGYCPKDKVVYGDFRDAFMEADRNLADFVLKLAPYENTTVFLLGDHLFMGDLDFLADKTKRTMYQLIINPFCPLDKNKRFTSLDIAPTILQSAGAKWGNDNFGLGVSLYSHKPTLLEEYGVERLNTEFLKHSNFYEQFF